MKRKAGKLKLSRETLRSLADGNLEQAVGAAVMPISIPVCTKAISDCYKCTVYPDVCPTAMNCPSRPPECVVT